MQYVVRMTGWTLITVEELEANAEAIIDRAEAGERFNVSRNGVITMTVAPTSNPENVVRDDQYLVSAAL